MTTSESNEWAAAWATAVQRPSLTPWYPNWSEDGFDHHSVRQVIRVSVGGSRLRIRLSNEYGTAPLRLSGASIGKTEEGAAVRPETMRPLSFGGSTAVTVPAGEQVASDPIELPVEALEQLTVTLYFEEATGPSTFHSVAMSLSYRADGDHLDAPGAAAFTQTSFSWYYLAGVDVPDTGDTVVLFGDSLTDGYGATPGADDRYPDELAKRLVAAGRATPVVNAGIGGNRVLNDSMCFGEKATARFQRDVLSRPRVGTVIVLEGINDIILEHDRSPCAMPNPRVSAKELIDGYRMLIRAAREQKIKIIGGTLPPFEGAEYYTEDGETVRAAVNDWIRSSGEYDAVVDFDKVLADPEHAGRLLPAYDSGDRLHPSPAGYRAMAEAVDLASL
ncbi:SGNH/GDSL hydrolase family protein [Nonomuraea sp. NPDC049400]|uniref:SGNH/GDSL hydrolase family protein n=1 Tax=Nonomuraea sp. NPDC049400 TaxID=3364352 RepID=UPI0037A62D87